MDKPGWRPWRLWWRPPIYVLSGRFSKSCLSGLRATLVNAGIAWFEDPGNANPLATRVRFRRKLQDPDRSGMETAMTAASARAFGALRQAQEEADVLCPGGAGDNSSGGLCAALARCASACGFVGPASALSAGRLIPRAAWMWNGSRGILGPATVAGVLLLPAGRLGDGFLVVREAAAMQPPVPAEAGVVWDRRFALSRGTVFIAGTTLGAIGTGRRRPARYERSSGGGVAGDAGAPMRGEADRARPGGPSRAHAQAFVSSRGFRWVVLVFSCERRGCGQF